MAVLHPFDNNELVDRLTPKDTIAQRAYDLARRVASGVGCMHNDDSATFEDQINCVLNGLDLEQLLRDQQELVAIKKQLKNKIDDAATKMLT